MTVPFEFVATGRPSSVNATTEKKHEWKRRVNHIARMKLRFAFTPGPIPPPYPHSVIVKIFYFPISRQYIDIDNGLKHTIDAISPPIIENDKAIQRIVVERFLPVPGAGLRAPISLAPTLIKAFELASGAARPGRRVQATAVKIEPYPAPGGTLW